MLTRKTSSIVISVLALSVMLSVFFQESALTGNPFFTPKASPMKAVYNPAGNSIPENYDDLEKNIKGTLTKVTAFQSERNETNQTSSLVEQKIKCGDSITINTTLSKDILDCTNYGLIIGKDSVFLDCQGHAITGNNAVTGVYINEIEGAVVKNCRVEGFGFGIYVLKSNQSHIINNILQNNNHGAVIYKSSSNILTQNQIQSNNNSGIYVLSGNSNLFWNNSLSANKKDNAYEYSAAKNNQWNKTIGNYWDDFSSNPGYPNYYEIPGLGLGIDWHPK